MFNDFFGTSNFSQLNNLSVSSIYAYFPFTGSKNAKSNESASPTRSKSTRGSVSRSPIKGGY